MPPENCDTGRSALQRRCAPGVGQRSCGHMALLWYREQAFFFLDDSVGLLYDGKKAVET
jgi:hypothetical protein